MSMKNSNDTIGNRTRDLPTCSAVPQQTALPRAPNDLRTVTYCGWTSQTSGIWRRAVCEVNPKVVEEPATSTFGIENFSISVILFLHRRKETWMGQSFLCFCTASRQSRMEVAIHFYIFLTSRLFGVGRSTVRLYLLTPLYPTDSKLGISHD